MKRIKDPIYGYIDVPDKLITEVLTQVSIHGIDKVLKKKNIKQLYKKYCIEDVKYQENS